MAIIRKNWEYFLDKELPTDYNRNSIVNNLKKEDIDMLKEVTKDMVIGEILQEDATVAPILMASGMHCIGCPASQGESLEEAAMVHGMDVDDLVAKINEYLSAKNA